MRDIQRLALVTALTWNRWWGDVLADKAQRMMPTPPRECSGPELPVGAYL